MLTDTYCSSTDTVTILDTDRDYSFYSDFETTIRHTSRMGRARLDKVDDT